MKSHGKDWLYIHLNSFARLWREGHEERKTELFSAGMLGITLGLSVSLSYGGETARVSVSTAGTPGNNNKRRAGLEVENGQFVRDAFLFEQPGGGRYQQ